MDIKAGLYNFLQNASRAPALIALVADRIYVDQAPQEPTLPYIVFSESEPEVAGHLRAPSTVTQPLFTFDIYASTSPSRYQVKEALRNTLDGRIDIDLSIPLADTVRVRSIRRQSGAVESKEPPPDGSEAGSVFVHSVDYLVTFGQTAATLP